MPSAVEITPAIHTGKKQVVAHNELKKKVAEDVTSGDLPREEVLHVTDGRTGQRYVFPIKHNSVHAGLFKQIKTAENEEYQADQNELGLRIYDPGYGNTAVSESKICYIDGTKGVIQYRGYDISDIIYADKGYYDVMNLLIWGEWPSDERKQIMDAKLKSHKVNENVLKTIHSFPQKSSILGMIIAGLSAMQSCEMEAIPAHVAQNIYLGNAKAVDDQIVRFLANMSSITAAAYCHYMGLEWHPPRDDFNYIENFLYMTGHVDKNTGKPNPQYVKNFEQLWILIGDHEMTCSTAAMLHTASSLPDVISCMISALSALYGPLHGGAIEVAYKNIVEIGSVENIPAKIDRVKAGKERLYGYGHRVYRVEDPRYVHIKRILDSLKEETSSNPMLRVAFEVDRIASTDEYFTSRKLRPNADLFAAFTYQAMGFPCEFILPLSCLSRMQGFMAHWKEAMCGTARIWRPAQIYTGELNKKI